MTVFKTQRKQDQSTVSQSTQEAVTLIFINVFMDHQAERDQNQMFRGVFEPVKVGLIWAVELLEKPLKPESSQEK